MKNVACNYSDAQVKVREATSNDPWGPSSSLMSEIADMTYNTMAFTEIMQIIWKRLNDHGKNWRHVYKSLVLLDYLIKVGSEKVAQQCRENIFAVQTLKDFQYIEENKDQGMNVREKAKQLVNLLKDDERLKNERARALMAKKRFAQNGVGIGSDGATSEFRRSDTYHGDDDVFSNGSGAAGVQSRRRGGSELEDCRPSSIGEEELQLQIALALSKEEAQREDEARKGDDMRLQMAISESRQEPASPTNSGTASGFTSSRAEKSAIDDLLSLQPTFGGAAAASASTLHDPWASSHPAPAVANTDPWGMPVANPPAHSPAMAVGATAANDPWAPPAGNDVFSSQPPAFGSSPSHGWPTVAGTNGTNGMQDPFAPSSTNGAHFASPAPPPVAPRPATADPWGMDTVKTSLPAQHTGGSDSGMKTRNLKTPEHFLGENSALVNLDNLMGPPKTSIAGVPPKSTVNNPFVGGSSLGTGASAVTSNPFAAQQRPSPTLNEMRTAAYQPPPVGSSSATSWGLPQPMQPASADGTASSTNPFL